jgi:hypothetical protein
MFVKQVLPFPLVPPMSSLSLAPVVPLLPIEMYVLTRCAHQNIVFLVTFRLAALALP